MKTVLLVLLIMAVFASEKYQNAADDTNSDKIIKNKNTDDLIVVKIEEDEYVKKKVTSKYIGVSYKDSKWYVSRRSKSKNRNVFYGCYDDEETAAHASDTLARELMKNSKQNLRLNFSDDDTEVHKHKFTSEYIGVSHVKKASLWSVQRWSKNENKLVYNGYYHNEETAAHASDTLARKLMKKGEQKLKLNFPDDDTEVHAEEKSSKYIGVSYGKRDSLWRVQRWSKNESKLVRNGYYDNEKTAAHASDALARKLMEKGEQNHKLNFPDIDTEEYQKKKRKRDDFQGN